MDVGRRAGVRQGGRRRGCVLGIVHQFFGSLGADWPTCLLCSFIALVFLFTVFLTPALAALATEWSAPKPFLREVELFNLSDKRMEKFQRPGSKRTETGDNEVPPPSELWDECEGMYERFRELSKGGDRDWIASDALRAQCIRLGNDVDRNEDPECRAHWMQQLLQSEVVGVGMAIGFGASNLGSLQLLLKDGSSAMFKPCAGPGEWPENEVIASHIDAALGFHRVAPVVTREIEASKIREVLERDTNWLQRALDVRLTVLDNIEHYCSPDGILRGSVIGWWSNLEATQTFPKKLGRMENPEDVWDIRASVDAQVLAEVVQNHFFFYLVGTLRVPGYNEYRVRYPDDKSYLLAVDLDRSSFQRAATTVEIGLVACRVCKLWESTWKRLQAANHDNALATAVRNSLLYDQGRIALPSQQEKVLQTRVRNLVVCVQECIAQHGWDDVIVPDP